jgi:tetratricopeptide (TPR) repeat protein
MAGRLRQPDSGLYDLARVLVEAASARIGTDHAPLPMPGSHELAVFDPAVAEAFAETGDLERAIRLATLSSERDEASRRQADLVVRKAKALAEQEAIAQVLARSSAFLKLGQHAEALKALDKAKADEPRVIRQRALLLLKLERFEEAEAEAAKLAGMTGSVARDFSSTFPTLSLRQRISTSSRMLREGSADEALEILKLAVPRTPEESVELAYCRGFGLTMRFHRFRRDGKTLEARQTLDEAMSGVEPQVAAARTLGHARLIELYEALDTELSRA